MSMRDRTSLVEVKSHPVLPEAWKYRVVGLNADFPMESQLASSIVLTLVREDSQVILRFDGIQELEIDAGFPYLVTGLQVLDVAYLQWDGIKIRVESFEQDPAIRFWARSVEQFS